MQNIRSIFIAFAAAFFFGFVQSLSAADDAAASIDAASALAKLQAGNSRFVSASKSAPKPTRARRVETAQSQHPFAIIVGCSDSRTPPEIIFDQNLGDLFVVRTAGEVVDDFALGSIEYAVQHLGARLIVICGHARCGAVKAALDGGDLPGHVGAITREIAPAAESVRGRPGDPLVNAIKSNVDRVAKQIREKASLGALASSVRVMEAYYDFDSGKVEWLKK